MKTYARLDENNIIRELLTLDDSADITAMFHPSLVWKNVTGLDVSEGLQYDPATETYSPAPEPTPDPSIAKAALRAAAQAGLDAADRTLLRDCLENNSPVPEEWRNYRVALRAIVSGTSGATELPARPPYPAAQE